MDVRIKDAILIKVLWAVPTSCLWLLDNRGWVVHLEEWGRLRGEGRGSGCRGGIDIGIGHGWEGRGGDMDRL